MFTIYKYQIPIADEFEILLPKDARILCVQAQYDEPRLWAIVNPNAAVVTRRFALRGTGHPVDDALADLGNTALYRGTFQIRNGALVFHLFERL